MSLSLPEYALDRIDGLIGRSNWMRFSLEYSRKVWTATFYHEKGRVYGKASRAKPDVAVVAAAVEAEKNTLHLIEENTR